VRSGVSVLEREHAIALAGIGSSVVLGAILVLQPTISWLLLAGITVVALLQFPPYVLAGTAVVVVAFSRLLVAWGIAPGFVNFIHFPVVLAAALFANFSSYRNFSRVGDRLLVGSGALGLLTVVSWAVNAGEFLKPIFTWLLFIEPFLVVYTFVRTAPLQRASLLGKLAISLAFAQVPLALWQAVTLGLADVVQGTFVGHGAGHHVTGAHALLGVITLTARLLMTKRAREVFLYLPIISLLLAVPVLADAKQAIIASIPAVAVLLWGYGKLRLRGLGVGAMFVLLLIMAGYIYRPLRMATDFDLIVAGSGGKVLSFQIIADKMRESPAALVIGLGPGNSVSRVALAAQEGYIRSLPSGWVDLGLSSTTQQILASTAESYLFASSSVWSGVSSWLGLLGDLGLAGLAIYTWLWWTVWRGLSQGNSFWSHVGKAALVMGVMLGAAFSWLEFPEFTLPWALYMATGLVRGQDEHLRYSQLVPATGR
jgi:hypothetical protein